MRPILISFLICVHPLFGAQPTLARPSRNTSLPKTSSEDSERTAKKACAEGDFKKGVSILTDLYVHSDDPTHIFNQGRCYEQNHQWVSAIDRFREYLRKVRKLSPEERNEAEEHIAECKRLQQEEEAKTAPAPMPQTPVVTPVPPPLTTAAPQPQPAPIITTPVATTKPGNALRTAGVVVGSVGVASLGVGVALNLKANQRADAGDGSGQSSYRNGALVCYGVGGVAVATGLVLYLLGHRAGDTTSSSVAFVPTWTHSGPALALHGGF
jgi:hypothetical protein